MTRGGKVIAWIVLLISFGIYYESRQRTMEIHASSMESQEVLFLPALDAVKVLSLGYEVILSELFMIHSQYYLIDRVGKYDDVTRENFTRLLWIAATLDPKQEFIYQFAAFALPAGFGNWGVANAVELLEYGARENPDNARIPEILGFIYLLNGGDKEYAARWFRVALSRPEANPDIVWLLERTIKPSPCDAELQYRTFERSYQLATDEENREEMKKKAEQYAKIATLQKTWTQFQRHKGPDADFNDLLEKLRQKGNLPKDPYGGSYLLSEKNCVTSTSAIDFASGPSLLDHIAKDWQDNSPLLKNEYEWSTEP